VLGGLGRAVVIRVAVWRVMGGALGVLLRWAARRRGGRGGGGAARRGGFVSFF
jgi:hypothetical protein